MRVKARVAVASHQGVQAGSNAVAPKAEPTRLHGSVQGSLTTLVVLAGAASHAADRRSDAGAVRREHCIAMLDMTDLDLALARGAEGRLVDRHDDHLVVAGQHQAVQTCTPGLSDHRRQGLAWQIGEMSTTTTVCHL